MEVIQTGLKNNLYIAGIIIIFIILFQVPCSSLFILVASYLPPVITFLVFHIFMFFCRQKMFLNEFFLFSVVKIIFLHFFFSKMNSHNTGSGPGGFNDSGMPEEGKVLLRLTNQPINLLINNPINPSSINQSIHSSINQSIHSSINQSIHSSINQSIHSSINQSIHSSINQSIHSSINQSIHSSINHSIN